MSSIISIAPARICLYGDHQDYLNLPIIAIAINRYIKVEAKSNLAEGFYINKLDLRKKDIIDYDNKVFELIINRYVVQIPHPRLVGRNFVLMP